jgi:hypothetical protein
MHGKHFLSKEQQLLGACGPYWSLQHQLSPDLMQQSKLKPGLEEYNIGSINNQAS